jgi:transposase
MRRLQLAAFVFAASFIFNVEAMTFHATPPTLYLGGAVVESDRVAWNDAMNRFGSNLTTIVFNQSGGGDSPTARFIGRDIRKRQFTTAVYGRCTSACATMFLGGTVRQFATTASKSESTVLGFHGSYNKTTKALIKKRSSDYFLEMTNGKMNEDFIEKFIRLENKKGLLRLIHPAQSLKQKAPLAMLCKGNELAARRVEQCEHLDGVDALKQGVVTTWEQREIIAPPAPSNEKVTVKSWLKN